MIYLAFFCFKHKILAQVYKILLDLSFMQARHNFSRTEGAAQKVGVQNTVDDPTFNVFSVKFQEK